MERDIKNAFDALLPLLDIPVISYCKASIIQPDEKDIFFVNTGKDKFEEIARSLGETATVKELDDGSGYKMREFYHNGWHFHTLFKKEDTDGNTL